MRLLSIKEKLKLVFFAVGVFVAHTLMGIFQQKIYEQSYDGDRFTFSVAFVAIQCIAYFITAKGDKNIELKNYFLRFKFFKQI